MDTPHSDLEALRKILADLTTRVYRIERKLQMDGPSVERPASAAAATSAIGQTRPTSSAVADKPAPVTPPLSHTPPPRLPPRVPAILRVEPDSDLESRIGSHWLNRIGILAVLIGLSYFLKFAFDNNWIGRTGRVTIGLLAGIAIVIWSERCRICHDAGGDRGHRRHGVEAGCTDPRRIRARGRIQHSTSAVYRAEPRSRIVYLRGDSRSGHAHPGNLQALATLARHELRRHAAALHRLVLKLLQPKPTQSHPQLRHAVVRHLCDCTADHAATGRRDAAACGDSPRPGVCECKCLFPAGLRHDRGSRQEIHGVVRARSCRRLHLSQPLGPCQRVDSRSE